MVDFFNQKTMKPQLLFDSRTEFFLKRKSMSLKNIGNHWLTSEHSLS